MTYETDKMMLFGYEEKKRFLKELQENFGKDASLESILQKLSQEEPLPIDQCRFTGISVYGKNAYELAGDHDEFTGTIKEILEQIDISPSDEDFEAYIDKFVEMFCHSEEDWIEKFGPTTGINARCVPIDRAVSEEEVKAYLKKLAVEAKEDL